MANERARITVRNREKSVEIEGSEKYVEGKLKDPDSIDGLLSKVGITRLGANLKREKREKDVSGRKPKKRKGGFQIVKDLDLAKGKNKEALKDFYEKKKPMSYMEKNAVFVYYLKKIAKINNVSTNHVYSCYKQVDSRVPGNLIQSLLDTAHHKGWIDTSKMDDINIPTVGENFVEHDMPKSEKSE